jgi:hypothetical protein
LPFRVLGEGHLHLDVAVGLGADQLVFEAGDELAGAQHQLGVGGRAAFEGHAVQLAEEVDDDHVAVLGLHGLAGPRLVGAVLLGEFGQGLVDFGVGRLVDRTGQRQGRGIHRLEVGHHVDGDLVGEVRLAVDHLLHVAFRLQVRVAGRAQLVVFQHLLGALVERLFDDLAHQRLAVQAAHVGGRHLAGAESLDVEGRRDLGDPRLQLVGQVLGRDRHAVDAAQAFARLFNDLHRHS